VGVLSTSSPSKPDAASNGSLARAVHRGSAGTEAVSVFEARWYAESRTGQQAKLSRRMLL
jgi:hypothetical protein